MESAPGVCPASAASGGTGASRRATRDVFQDRLWTGGGGQQGKKKGRAETAPGRSPLTVPGGCNSQQACGRAARTRA